jgi:hypothetical protein
LYKPSPPEATTPRIWKGHCQAASRLAIHDGLVISCFLWKNQRQKSSKMRINWEKHPGSLSPSPSQGVGAKGVFFWGLFHGFFAKMIHECGFSSMSGWILPGGK